MPSSLPLSCLVPSRSNPRKTKPDRDAHARLVASIAAHGLLHPLVVAPLGNGKAIGKAASGTGKYGVIAGNRRYAALRELHANDPSTKVPVNIRAVDQVEAEALSLAENFEREAMHPLDEAIAFAALATAEGKDAAAIASDFGVSKRFVLQRLLLSGLARPIADAYRAKAIDSATAEAFCAVPARQQMEIWKKLNGAAIDAATVRHLIRGEWINATKALFDVKTLPPEAVSADLFSEEVLIERQAFLKAQQDAVAVRQKALQAEGWAQVVVTDRDAVRDRLWSMDKVQPRFDPPVEKQLRDLQRKLGQFDKQARKLKFNHPRLTKVRRQMDAIDARAVKLVTGATPRYDEGVRKAATVFVITDPDGSVHEERRIARPKPAETATANGRHATANGSSQAEESKPDAERLSDGQRGTVLAAHAYAVREAVLADVHVCKVLTVMAMCGKLRSPAIALRDEANPSTLHAEHDESFQSGAKQRIGRQLEGSKVPALSGAQNDLKVFEALSALPNKDLDRLIALFTVDLLSHGAQRPQGLLLHLAGLLKVNIRKDWTPAAAWLRPYRKAQLADLLMTLCGRIAAPAPDAKHGDLVLKLDKLFKEAATGTLAVGKLAETVNRWLPTSVGLGPTPASK
ncbi:MAG: ParB/RepB/Spo0J family partition protein [Tepidisphaeraceae bacterium]